MKVGHSKNVYRLGYPQPSPLLLICGEDAVQRLNGDGLTFDKSKVGLRYSLSTHESVTCEVRGLLLNP